MPAVSCSWLASVHPHPRDNYVVFEPLEHAYFVSGQRVPRSVTGLVHLFTEDFDAEKAIALMMTGRNWPRSPYLTMADCGALRPMTSAEIQRKWRLDAASAATAGTWTHLQVETLLNGGFVAQQCVELQLFATFLQTAPKALAYRTEWVIFGEDERLAGCIDFVAAVGPQEVLLFDWKRTKSLREKYHNPWRCMRSPLSHLSDCAGNCYRLQLNLYRFLAPRLRVICILSRVFLVFVVQKRFPSRHCGRTFRSRNIMAYVSRVCMWSVCTQTMPIAAHLWTRCRAWMRR